MPRIAAFETAAPNPFSIRSNNAVTHGDRLEANDEMTNVEMTNKLRLAWFYFVVPRFVILLDSHRLRPMRPANDDLVAVFAYVADRLPRGGYFGGEQSIVHSDARPGIERGQSACFEQRAVEDCLCESSRKRRSPKLYSSRARHTVPGIRCSGTVVLP